MTAAVLCEYARAFGLAEPPESIEAMYAHLASVPRGRLRDAFRRSIRDAEEHRTSRSGITWQAGTVPASWVRHAPSQRFPRAVEVGFHCAKHDVEHIDRWVDGTPTLPAYQRYPHDFDTTVAVTNQTPVRPARNR